MAAPTHSRRGEGIVDHLLVLTVACVAVLVAAWIYMPDAKRSFATTIASVLQYFGFEVI